ncbi:SRPBCC family protein [Nocardia sp. NBC_00511]|uniref:SRPBCC family protein n=1 Tax=Nocardia sp. NBC_00511 TaxID=2903591 RepID=UPI0030E199FB
MASIVTEIVIDVAPEQVWAVVSDFAGGPLRMAPGLVTASASTGEGTREVTFTGGTVVRERLVTLDHEIRRFVYSVYDGSTPPVHDNAVIEVSAHGDGAARVVWSRDLLPEQLAGPYTATMQQGLSLFKKTLEG